MNDHAIEDYGVVHSFSTQLPVEKDKDALLLSKTLARVLLVAMHNIGYGVNDGEWLALVFNMEDVEHKLSIAHIGNDAIEFDWDD